ncbi:MAG: hypothetical protein ACREA9_23320 [Pyrinomonadaceae bacterium]
MSRRVPELPKTANPMHGALFLAHQVFLQIKNAQGYTLETKTAAINIVAEILRTNPKDFNTVRVKAQAFREQAQPRPSHASHSE